MNTSNYMRSPSARTNSSRRNTGADTSAISVTELNRQVKSMLENSFLSIRVQGELSNFAKPSSGHWYFTLKDPRAQIRCAMFKGSNRHLNFNPKEGDEVVVQAKVSLYEGRGDYQLICTSMEEAGSGRLQLAFEQLKAKLLKEGLFDSNYKRKVPALAKHLCVITSPTGAAIHDVLSVLKRRFPALAVTIIPSQVQGAQASDTLIQALQLAQQTDCDLILITRGGGSLEDLWPFNEEKLARAIFNCSIPTISAIGHEVDFSISDLVADYRAATPSAAAEYISPDQDSLKIQIDQLQQRLYSQIRHLITNKRNGYLAAASKLQSPTQRLALQNLTLSNLRSRLNKLPQQHLSLSQQQLSILKQKVSHFNPRQLMQNHKTRIDFLKIRNQQLIEQRLAKQAQTLKATATLLHGVSPLATLDRGYSITQTTEKDVIINSNELKIGQSIITKLQAGEIASTVTEIK
jgi:exodeoxyribonuclease VII large subunit